jgi:hypothetical protein
MDHVFKISTALGVEPRDLLPGGPPPGPAFPALDAAIRAGDPHAALRALADALQATPPPTLEPEEQQMIAAMRAGDPGSMMLITANYMKKRGLK